MVTATGHASSGHPVSHVTAEHTSAAHPLNPTGPYLVVTHVPAANTFGQMGAVEEKKEDPTTVNDDYARQGTLILGCAVILVIVVVGAWECALRARKH